MRTALFVLAIALGAASIASAQPAAPAIPPVPLPSEDPALPGGSTVSRPLQPVEEPKELPPIVEPKHEPETTPDPAIDKAINDRDAKPNKVLGNWWDSDELLIWWPKAQPLPPLITASRGPLPAFGANTTSLLAGNKALNNQDIAGYRLAMGFSLNSEDTLGFEGRYFFLGTRTFSESATDLGDDRYRQIGLSFKNALTGQEDALVLAKSGVTSALITAYTSTRVQGAEANVIGNLYASGGLKIHAIAGYRFLQANEGVRIESTWSEYGTPQNAGGHQVLGMIADQFDAHNEFHGGQVGLMADAHRGMFYCEFTGKAALGTNFEMVRIDGATHLITANYPIPLYQSWHGGVYAQGTNIGRYTRSQFAVVPEGMFKVGLKMGERGRFYVGYNFLYLSDAVRPGDQIDRTLNPMQIPLNARGVPYTGPDRPVPTLIRSDFWTQGLILGFEARF
jgi:hypothetical protein